MSWLDTLRDRGMQAKRGAEPVAAPAIAREVVNPREPKPEIKCVWITTRRPRDGDAGEAQPGYYSVANGVLTMRDEKGKATGKSYRLSPGDDPHQIAGRLTAEAWLKAAGKSDFNRPLHYPKSGFA